MNNTKDHQQLCDDLLFAIGSRIDAKLFPRKCGTATPIGGTRPIKWGIKGEADLQGFQTFEIREHKIAVATAFEIKTGKGLLSGVQHDWKTMFEKSGGIYIVARSLDQAVRDYDHQVQKIYAVIG